MFFSEDQKKSLKEAYSADPYPNQTTLEELASSLAVSTKTVINWFHNYRMRAKQQVSIPSSQSNPFNCQNSSTSSEDKSELFNYYSEDDKENACSEISVDDTHSPELSFHAASATNFPGDNDSEHGEQSKEDSYVENEKFLCMKDESNDSEALSKTSGALCKNLNKRKSNKPQWLYEGTQLERCSQDNAQETLNEGEQEDADKEDEVKPPTGDI